MPAALSSLHAILANGSGQECPLYNTGGYNTGVSAATTSPVSSEALTPSHPFTLWQRLQLWLITWAGFLVVWLIGPTLRFSASYEEGAPPTLETRPIVYAFWHSCIIPAMYLWRNLQIRVMSSDSFDGEWMGRIMRKFGFVKVRGSKSRGAVRALLGMRRELEQGWTVAFTIDGPRGPRYVAKPGPVVLARATGVPMAVFHIAVEKAWILNTWDRSMIPKPFSRALMRVARKIPVPADADDSQKEQFHAELQAALERVREFAEANVGKVGTAEFPVRKS
ncbi:MAG TPA: lysophospholipid acyltransferase family protein [Terriglobales bacterium]|nr:lysophospholipid acyltransferase family protein [Terriglobales bacterium]